MTNSTKYKISLALSLALTAFSADAQSGHRPLSPYDVSVLLKAEPQRALGQPPHFDFDFTQTPFIPIFQQAAGRFQSKPVEGLLTNSTKDQILNVLEKLPGDEPLSFPFKAAVVGLRLDPCFITNPRSECLPQLRLIAEEPDLTDRSVHLIYSLSAERFSNFLNELVNLNDRCAALTDIAQLWVHPCGSDADFISRLNKLLFKFADEQSLVKVAFQIRTSDNLNGVFWIFGATEKIGERWRLATTDSAPHGEEFFSFGPNANLETGSSHSALDQKVVSGLRKKLSREELKQTISELEDPGVRTMNNTSCMACHSTQALRSQIETAKIPRGYFRVGESELTSFLPGQADIRHFGYMFGVPKVSRRVRVETDAVLEQLRSR